MRWTQISYNGYCQLGGALNPNLMRKARYNGSHFMGFIYYLYR